MASSNGLNGSNSRPSLVAHPMGNFSVNHYARLAADAHGVAIHYVMDLAEIPTFELFRS